MDFFVSDYKSVELDGSDKDLGNYGEVLFGTALGLGLAGPIAMPTGWILLLILCVMVFFAMPFIRRKGYFQVKLHPFFFNLF